MIFNSQMLALITNDFMSKSNINHYFAEISLTNGEVLRVNRVRNVNQLYPWMNEKQGCQFAIKKHVIEEKKTFATDELFRDIHQAILTRADNVLKIHAEIVYDTEVTLKFDRYKYDGDETTANRITPKPSVTNIRRES